MLFGGRMHMWSKTRCAKDSDVLFGGTCQQLHMGAWAAKQ